MQQKTLLACLIGLVCSGQAMAQQMETAAINFDQETLRSLGINPDVSNYFSRKTKYLPGSVSVALKVNGDNKGNVIARFDNNGDLCFDKPFMEQAGLKVPSDYESGCYDYTGHIPSAIVEASPAQESLSLVVPADRIANSESDIGAYTSGGTAALLNYSLLSSRNEFGDGHSDYSQAMLDGGVNFDDWILRTQQLLSRSDGEFESNNSSTYLQHTFVPLKSTLRAGEVNINNSLLQGTGIYGIELSSESALQQGGSGVSVSGIANTPQARIEVRQQNVLVYSTLVPVGPFNLTDVPVRNGVSDLNVTVVETDGSQHSYVVPAALYNQSAGAPSGYHFALGRVSDSYSETPWVASLSGGWKLSERVNVNAGSIVGEDYQAVATSLDTVPLPAWLVSLQANQSNDSKDSLKGQRYTLSATWSSDPAFGMGANASATHKSQDYRELFEALDDDFDSGNKNEYSAGLTWSVPYLGTLSTSYYQTQGYDKSDDSRFISAGWNKSFKYATISMNWQHQLSADEENEDDGDLFYVNLSIPFGASNSVSLYSRHDDHKTRYGASALGVVSDTTSWSLGAEHDQATNRDNVNGGISSNLHYTQLGLSASSDNENSRSYSGSLQGGIAVHGQGVTFSPWAIRDTFAIAALDKPVSGVRIDTPQGPVWTDFRGQAVVPSVGAWRPARVEVDTETLPKNMDIGNGTRVVTLGKGAVGHLDFTALTQRRALVNVTLANGKKLPKGIALEDSHGNYLTTSVDDGVVFFNDVEPAQLVVAKLDNGTCAFGLKLPKEANTDTFYETVNEVCK